ncbi:MAG: PadR family transcriptional regulator [Bacteroidales bacterium]|jgi:PadR family transcriptional regulator PadR|nr:PadR family transcriptional regulator [Bacteroidales bacterium]
MKVENIQSQMRKGVLEYCILSIIKNGEVYPGDIIEEVKNAGLHLFEGTLYPLLNRLKNADILSYRWVESTTGPPRKYFSLTPKGLEFYELLETTWSELSASVDILINKAHEIEGDKVNEASTSSEL